MGLVEVKTAELVGPALDWCVCMVATGAEYHDDYGRATLVMPGAAAMMDGLKRPGYAASVPDYSSDWALGGPLIDKYDVWLSDDEGACVASCPPHAGRFVVEGGTNLIAACRAIVNAETGDVVQVPAELVGVAA
ncbi:hypothetical protein D3C87_1662740 [compost metagenome]